MRFFLLIRRQPTSTLFPYTTLFRSLRVQVRDANGAIGQFWIAPDQSLMAAILGTLRPESQRPRMTRSEEHTSELQSQFHLVCRLLLEKKNRPALLPPRKRDTPGLTG